MQNEITTPSAKIIPFAEVAPLFARIQGEGRRIVHCHGVFDLLHSGYIVYLEEARALGDVLVVSLMADKFVNKGPGRPLCKEQLRARTVAAIACVDYVVITHFTGAAGAMEAIVPDVYCLGKDYETRPQKSEILAQDLATAARLGTEVRYVGSVSFSTTKLLNQNFDHLPRGVKDFCHTLAHDVSMNEFRDAVESFSGLKVLVMGDTIFDRYSSLKVQGLTSKNRIISGRFLREETQCGGALAVFRHVRQFTDHVRFVSLLGTEPWVDPFMRAHVSEEEDRCVRDASFTSIIKQRFVEPVMEGKELGKLFSVNYIDSHAPSAEVQDRVAARIREEMAAADIVLLLDFGHGMMQEPIRRMVEESAPLLALNCQTNSNNHGFNIINRQYRRADIFTLDEQEMMLGCGHRHLDHKAELIKLRGQLQSRYAWLTRGAVQTIGLRDDAVSECPPLETEVVDSIGAGDAFFSVAALAAARQLPIGLCTFLGQLAGAQAVRIVGNQHPIAKASLLNAGSSLLNF